MAELQLTNGRTITGITEITDGSGGLLNVHTHGSGYYPIDPTEWGAIFDEYGNKLDITPEDIRNE